MKKHHVLVLLAVLALFGAAAAQAAKVTICHIPPGNPTNWHTITISENALQTHLDRHGDLVGSCAEVCEQLCDDGDACTQDVLSDLDECICQADPPPVDCDDGNDCTVDSCSSAAGACVYDLNILDGEVCDDGDPATNGEVCGGGECTVDEEPEPNECDNCVQFDGSCDGQFAGAKFQSCDTCGGYIECIGIFGTVAPQLQMCPVGTSWDDLAKACLGSSSTCNYNSCTGPGGFPS